MADTGFPLPSSSYKELIKIVQGYGRIGTEATLTDVATTIAMNETVVSANNKFLVSIGIIKGGKKKAITPLGAELAGALEHDMTEEIGPKWRSVVDASDFLQKILAAVRIRKGMDESTLESHVAYSAGQPKTPSVATGAATVVNILKAAGLLKDDGNGNLVATSPEPRSIPETVEKTLSISDSMTTSDNVQVQVIPAARLAGVQLTIDVRVQCTPNDLQGLGQKLRKVIDDFNRAGQSEQEAQTTTPPAPPGNEETEG